MESTISQLMGASKERVSGCKVEEVMSIGGSRDFGELTIVDKVSQPSDCAFVLVGTGKLVL